MIIYVQTCIFISRMLLFRLLVSTAGRWIIMTGVPNLWTDRCSFCYLFQTGATALFLAAQGGYLDIARALLRAGSRVNAQCNVMSLVFISLRVHSTAIRFSRTAELLWWWQHNTATLTYVASCWIMVPIFIFKWRYITLIYYHVLGTVSRKCRRTWTDQ